MASRESPFVLADVGKDDIIIVRAPDGDASKWTFNVPGLDVKVWVGRVTNASLINQATKTFRIDAHFSWNPQRDLTKRMTFDSTTHNISLEEESLFGVYDNESNFKLNKKDVADLVKVIDDLTLLSEDEEEDG